VHCHLAKGFEIYEGARKIVIGMRPSRMKFRFLAGAMFLSSCVTWQPLGSYEPQTDRNYNRDLYECEREATFAGRDNKQKVFDNCMKARGYKQKS
jgi:hypothetical protein